MSEEIGVAERVASIRSAIEDACRGAERSPADVTLIGASKRQPDHRIVAAFESGLRLFGENQVQEAIAKIARLPREIEWHFLGPLQSNKVRRIVPHVKTVHSVDRLKIARALDREAARLGSRLEGFLELNLGGEASKHGFSTERFAETVEPLAELEHLEIVGLMAIPPFASDVDAQRAWFRRLRVLRDELFSRSPWSSRPGYLSMGMSDDFTVAIEEGATHIRIGTSLFGPRTT